jgi:lipoprotein-anchoring transpeptidase ErfK/SrfK
MSGARVGRRRVAVGLVSGGVGAALLFGATSRLFSGEQRSTSSLSEARGSAIELRDAESLPAAPRLALAVPRPRVLADKRFIARWANVIAEAEARSEPSPRARIVSWFGIRTPEGTANIVLVLRSARDMNGQLWVMARIPGLPGETTGWIPRSALGGYHMVRTHLVVDLERFTAVLYADGRPVFRARIGVGKPLSPTPRGNFYIRDELDTLDGSLYGPLAFGTSARSPVLTDWPGGGFIGIHGTNDPGILPGRVSHGCIRLRNQDILRLGHLMPVGTPLSIV